MWFSLPHLELRRHHRHLVVVQHVSKVEYVVRLSLSSSSADHQGNVVGSSSLHCHGVCEQYCCGSTCAVAHICQLYIHIAASCHSRLFQWTPHSSMQLYCVSASVVVVCWVWISCDMNCDVRLCCIDQLCLSCRRRRRCRRRWSVVKICRRWSLALPVLYCAMDRAHLSSLCSFFLQSPSSRSFLPSPTS